MTKLPSQMLKGVLEYAVLQIIAVGPTYGYELQTRLAALGFGPVTEGTIYPILLKLQRNGQLQATRRLSASGPPRKYYAITADGQAALAAFTPAWQQLVLAMTQLGFKEESSDES